MYILQTNADSMYTIDSMHRNPMYFVLIYLWFGMDKEKNMIKSLLIHISIRYTIFHEKLSGVKNVFNLYRFTYLDTELFH